MLRKVPYRVRTGGKPAQANLHETEKLSKMPTPVSDETLALASGDQQPADVSSGPCLVFLPHMQRLYLQMSTLAAPPFLTL